MLDCTYGIDVVDIEHLSRGHEGQHARANRPCGQGPLAAAIDAHGGAWIAQDGFVHETNDRAGAAAK